MPLQYQGLITIWSDDFDINAGEDWEAAIELHLNTAQIILLLGSPNFMASEYCYSKGMLRAVERHERGNACVIPVILRPVNWQKAPFGKVQALPSGGKPVMSPSWRDKGQAFFNVAEGIGEVVEQLNVQSLRPSLSITIDKSRPNSARSLSTSKAKEYRLMHTLEGHLSWITTLAISPDGQTLVSGSDDETIKVWNLPTGELLDTLEEHSGSVYALAISPDGQILASGGADRTIKIWEKSVKNP